MYISSAIISPLKVLVSNFFASKFISKDSDFMPLYFGSVYDVTELDKF
jgi:hypothetical protein